MAFEPDEDSPMPRITRSVHYWLVCTSPENFEASRAIGFAVNGFKSRICKIVEKVRPGDRVVFYISGIRKFGLISTATSPAYMDTKEKIWVEADELWPCRFKQRPNLVLDQDEFVDARRLVPQLSFVTEKQRQTNWGLAFGQSFRDIPKEDFELIESEIRKVVAMRGTAEIP